MNTWVAIIIDTLELVEAGFGRLNAERSKELLVGELKV